MGNTKWEIERRGEGEAEIISERERGRERGWSEGGRERDKEKENAIIRAMYLETGCTGCSL